MQKLICVFTFLTLLITGTSLIITLSPRPSLVISINNDASNQAYVSTEVKNVGDASAFDFEYTLLPEIKTPAETHKVRNAHDPMFAKTILPSGRVFQGGRQSGVTSDMQVRELLVRYYIQYRYELTSIPFFNKIKLTSRVKGLLSWNGKKWDVR